MFLYIKLFKKICQKEYFLILLQILTITLYFLLLEFICYDSNTNSDNDITIFDFLLMNKEYLFSTFILILSYWKLHIHFMQKQLKLIGILLMEGCTYYFIKLFFITEMLLINLGAFLVSNIVFWPTLTFLSNKKSFDFKMIIPAILIVFFYQAIICIYIPKHVLDNKSILSLYKVKG